MTAPRSSIALRVALGGVAFYRRCLSAWFGGRCRFEPSCSVYAEHALRRHGVLRGGLMAARRLSRCHPWGGAGHDPVPPTRS